MVLLHHPSPRRIALEISGALRASEASVLMMEALVVGHSNEIHGFTTLGLSKILSSTFET
jgi:hypothetical protein